MGIINFNKYRFMLRSWIILKIMTNNKSNELFEMANVSKKDTKLSYDIWIDSEGKNRNTKHNYPKVIVDCNGDRIPVSISEEPVILVKKKIPEFPKIKIWIKKYSVVLLQHWNKEITDKEALNQLGE